MQWFIIITLGITVGLIFHQDLKTRAVMWPFFPVLGLIGVIYSVYHSSSIIELLQNAFINISFLLLQYFLLVIFQYLRSRDNIALISKKIGWGDILLVTGCAFFFSPVNFVVFYVLSLLFTICLHFVLKASIAKSKYAETVPMAGLQALFLFLYVAIHEITSFNLTNDDVIVSYIMP